LYIAKSIKFIKQAWINRGSGILDFLDEIKELKPDIFFVNEDGEANAKKDLCQQLDIEYVVSKRIPKDNLPARSTTDIREKSIIPYRLDLAGGWLDQPYVSRHHPGSVITISIEPTREFNNRSGMSSSTRKKAVEIWGYSLPDDNPEKLAKILFSFENPPGKTEISGSQDSIGIVFPGLNKLHYSGDYWPDSIESNINEDILSWIEKSIHFIPLSPRSNEYDVLKNTQINQRHAKNLANATDNVWEAIHKKDLVGFGKYFRKSFEAQVKMFPNMINNEVINMIDKYKESALGWKLSGAGGGGYLVLISENPITGSFKIKIKR
jgi:galactokinase/mevalonate kinase-like predicted kinase